MPARRTFSLASVLGLALVVLVTPGCMKRKSTLVLGKDGSGSLTDHLTLDLSKFTEIADAVGAMAPMLVKYVEAGKGGTDVADIQKRMAGKTCMRLQRTSQTHDFEANTLAAEVRLKFTSLADCLSSAPGTASARNSEVSLEQGVDGTWTLTQKLVPGGFEVPETLPPEVQAQADMGKLAFADAMSAFEMVFEFEVPGTIVATNGTKSEAGNTVTWKLGFEEITDPKNLKQTVTFKGEGLTLKPFRIRLDESGQALAKPPALPGGIPGGDAPKEPAKAPDAPKEPAAPAAPAAPGLPK